MKYPVVIHTDDNETFGVTIPDIPGCTAVDTGLDKALKTAIGAVDSHLDVLYEDGETIPLPGDIATHLDNQDYADGIWAYIDIDLSRYSGKTEKVNVTLPQSVIHRIDRQVAAGQAKSRSAFLAEAALKVLG